jgi:hypothetical protein
MSSQPSVTLTANPSPITGGTLDWSASGLSNDEGGVVQFGFIPHGVDPAPAGAGFLVVQQVTADSDGNASGSVPLPLAGVPALPPDLRTEPIYPGATFDCYAYDAAAGSTAGYSNGVTVVVGTPLVLGSNSNFIFDAGCDPIQSPSISIAVTQELLANNGFGFQWNAYSPAGGVCAYQQYCLIINPEDGALDGAVDNWPITGDNLLNDFFELYSPAVAGLQVGDSLSMSLVTDPVTGNVTACVFHYNNVTQTLELSSIAGFQESYLAPITAFELDLVGPYDSETTTLSSGAGTIFYAATNAMSPLSTPPTCTETTDITAETANSAYGGLTADATGYTQTFSTAAETIRKPGPVRRFTSLRGRTPRKL